MISLRCLGDLADEDRGELADRDAHGTCLRFIPLPVLRLAARC
jgi:hypothetical protein